MAEITISELPAKTSLLDSDLIVIDDGTQSYRVTGAQLREFLKVNFLSVGTVVWSQSALAPDNPGRLPLWTGEYIASASTIYPDFYTWVKGKHPELCKTKEQYDLLAETEAGCPFYVVDEEEGSLRLPKLKAFIKNAGEDGITQGEAGLPNITGQTNFAPNAGIRNDAQARGSFYTEVPTTYAPNFTSSGGYDLSFDASLSSEVYGKSDTVTPAHTTLFPWVFAFNATVPASTAQAAEFQEGLSGKADADLNNTIPSKTFRENVFSWGLPDLTSGVTKSWNTDITAETNGWVNVKSYTIQGDTASCLIINGVEVYKLWCGFDAQVGYQNMWPVYKGDVYKATGGNSGQTITFYPCKGEVL